MANRMRSTARLGLLLCFAASFASLFALGRVAAEARGAGDVLARARAAGQAERPTSTPYSGDLSIFEYPDRDKKLHVDRVMDLLDIAPGKVVADIGAGSGWFTMRAAARVGPGGLVYAEDINAKAIDYIRDRAVREKLENVRPVLGTV